MGRKLFSDFANTLLTRLVGWHMGADLEKLAELPDSILTIDVLSGHSYHSVAGEVRLRITDELKAWLGTQLAKHCAEGELKEISLKADIRTDQIATERKQIVSFDFNCKSTIRSKDKVYHGTLVGRHICHRRDGA